MVDNLVPKISIIVPVYKTEQYLSECIDSILTQSFTDFELLLIDDGSPDKSGDICENYAKKDDRVRVFHKKNGGVSSARNLGLDHSKAYWITFVDSDDYLHKDALFTLYSKVNIGVDMVVYASEIGKKPFTCGDYLTREQAITSLITFKGFPSSLYLSLYNIEKIQNLRLDESIHYWEDFDFQFTYLLATNNIAVNHFSAYFYRQREGSATHSGFNERVYSCLKIPEKIRDQLYSNSLISENDLATINIFFLSQCFVSMLLDVKCGLVLKRKLIANLAYYKNDIKQTTIIGFKLKYLMLLNTYTSHLNPLFRFFYKKIKI